VGIALEATPGTPIAMSNTMIVEKFDWEDKPKWLDDKGWRQWMSPLAGRQVGPLINDFSMSGNFFGDVLPFVLSNLFGDLVPTGTTTTPTTTLSATTATPTVGAPITSITTAASIPLGTIIQIDTGALAEIRKTGTPSGAGPYTIPFAAGERSLLYPHTSGVAVTAVTAPYTSAFSVLNSGATAVYGQGQPPTHTITHYQGVTATVGARQFPGACCSELSLMFNAESSLVQFDSKWQSWPSVIAPALPVSAPSSVLPIASWRGAVGIGGPASGGTKVNALPSLKLTFKRKLEPDWTLSGVQTPYIIQRGAVDVAGEMEIIADSESQYLNMINNSQPQFQALVGNGLAGANLIQLQIDANQASYNAAKMDASKENIRYKIMWDGITNTTNAGGSGGGSPVKATVTNATTPNTYQ
jgi:hypothetical protein